MIKTWYNELKYNLYMEYTVNKLDVYEIWDKYKDHNSFSFREREQLEDLLKYKWEAKEQIRKNNKIIKELNEQISKQKKILRKSKRIEQDIKKLKRQEEKIEKLALRKLEICVEEVIRFKSNYFETYFPNPEGLNKKPIFSFFNEFHDHFKFTFGKSIKWLCDYLEVSESGFYQWRNDGESISRNLS